jgi:hypothetical protein
MCWDGAKFGRGVLDKFGKVGVEINIIVGHNTVDDWLKLSMKMSQ